MLSYDKIDRVIYILDYAGLACCLFLAISSLNGDLRLGLAWGTASIWCIGAISAKSEARCLRKCIERSVDE